MDAAGREKQLDLNTNLYTEALRKIAPDTGAYINEVGFLYRRRCLSGTNPYRLICMNRTSRRRFGALIIPVCG